MELKEILAQNLLELRKAASLTQMELAEKLNYSDKSVSKWEHGDSVPDIEVLARIAGFYGVTVDYLISEHENEPAPLPSENNDAAKRRVLNNRIIITLLAASVVWIASTVIYVWLLIWSQFNFWQVFVWSVPASAVVLIVFHAIWSKSGNRFSVVLTSVLVWSLITALFLQFLKYKIWPLYFVGAPLQIAIVLWSRLKKKTAI